MKLTGKCKADFEKWLCKEHNYTDDEGIPYANDFYELPNSMQYGVYVDYFDSVGIIIEITTDHKKIPTFWVDINNKQVDDIELNTRQESRTKAIEKANEIYNEKL